MLLVFAAKPWRRCKHNNRTHTSGPARIIKAKILVFLTTFVLNILLFRLYSYFFFSCKCMCTNKKDLCSVCVQPDCICCLKKGPHGGACDCNNKLPLFLLKRFLLEALQQTPTSINHHGGAGHTVPHHSRTVALTASRRCHHTAVQNIYLNQTQAQRFIWPAAGCLGTSP